MTTLKMESLVKAEHDFGFAVDHLRDALKDATPLESLLILPLIERAATAKRDLNALIKAKNQPPDLTAGEFNRGE